MSTHRKHWSLFLLAAALAMGGCGRKAPIQLETALVDRLVDASNRPVNSEGLLGADYYLLYFSAHWCPPCRAFTPQLVKFYNENGGGKLFHVFLVSSDQDSNAMLAYMKEMNMPWQAVKFNSDTALQLKETYSGPGIPCLVMIDRSGKVLADSYDGSTYLGPRQVLDQLKKRIDKRKADPAGVIAPKPGETLPAPSPIEKRYRIDGFGQRGGKGAAIINGKLLVEGDEIEPAVTVEVVGSNYVEISCEGNRYHLAP
jgi:nucleoredoxin